MNWKRFLKQWLVLVMVLVSVTSCELDRYGTSMALPVVECQPGEWEYKGNCVPAGLPPDMPCPPGETLLDDGRCQPAGLPLDMQCPPGELALDNGKCQPAGVPPEMCGEGFEPDGKMGCNAVLPAEACPFGLMAVPGETECHEVAPCGVGTWGDIPVDQTTQFVNQSYFGNDSDGTKERPWKTIAEGIWEADAGAVVAVAEGTYPENLFINKQVKLWGVCPKKVTVIGTGTKASITIKNSNADGAQVRNLAIASASRGIDVLGVSNLVIDGVWIHDTALQGLTVFSFPNPASVILEGSLIEMTHAIGIQISSAEIAATNIMVRDVVPFQGGARGIQVADDGDSKQRSKLLLKRSLLERVPEMGIDVFGSDAQIETSVVRNGGGPGIAAIADSETRERSQITTSQTVIEGNKTAGIRVTSSDATIRSTVVSGTRLDPSGAATGIVLENNNMAFKNANEVFESTNGPTKALIQASTIDGSEEAGLKVFDSTATMEGCIIRNTQSPLENGQAIGMYIDTVYSIPLPQPASVSMRGSVVDSNDSAGILLVASKLTLEATIVRDQQWYGLFIHEHDTHLALADIRKSIIERNRGIGVAVYNSMLKLNSSIVRDTMPYALQSPGLEGRGVVVQTDPDEVNSPKPRAKAFVQASVIEGNHSMGFNVQSSTAIIDTTIVRGTQPDESGDSGSGIVSNFADTSIDRCVIEDNHQTGVQFLSPINAVIKSTIVRRTQPNGQNFSGKGIIVVGDSKYGSESETTIVTSLVEENHEIGILVHGAHANIESTIVRGTRRDSEGQFGRGIQLQPGEEETPCYANIRNSVIDDNHDVGIFVGASTANIESTLVQGTKGVADGNFGDGIAVAAVTGAAVVEIKNVRVERSERASISNFGGNVNLIASLLMCDTFNMSTQPLNGFSGFFNDLGSNHCGCAEATCICQMANVFLDVPLPLPSIDPIPPTP